MDYFGVKNDGKRVNLMDLWVGQMLGMFGMDFRLEKMMMICVFCYFFNLWRKRKKRVLKGYFGIYGK